MNAGANEVRLPGHPQRAVPAAGCQQDGMGRVDVPGAGPYAQERFVPANRHHVDRLQHLSAKTPGLRQEAFRKCVALDAVGKTRHVFRS